MAEPGMLAACGLDCGSRSIRRYPLDPQAAAEVIPWYRKRGWLADGDGVAEAVAKKLVCNGCLGDRDAQWSADCWILQCCVDQKGLGHCAECREFPCDRLAEGAKSDAGCGKALARLVELRDRSRSAREAR